MLGKPVKITQARIGPPKSNEKYPGVKIVPAYHPAYCLRSADNFPALVTDVGKVVSNAHVGWEPPRFTVFDEPGEARKALQELFSKHHRIVVDIETGIDKDTGFDHPDHYQLLCIGLCYARGRAIVVGESALQDAGVRNLLGQALRESRKRRQHGQGLELIAQNGKFDLGGLTPIEEGRLWFDTMLASYAMDERAGVHGLEFLSVEKVGSPSWKHMLDKYLGRDKNYARVPRDVLYQYNAFDVHNEWLLYEFFDKTMTVADRRLHDFMVEASNEFLMQAELEGVQVDLEYLDYLTDHYLDGLEELEKELNKWVANPRSPKQVKEALGEFGITVQDTQADTLQLLFDQGDSREAYAKAHEFLGLMLKHRKEQKLYGTYVKGIRQRLYKGRVHPTFLLHGTTTGRLACRNPNLQNIPRESSIRRQFVPAEGNVFVQGDYKTIELRVVAVESGDPYLLEVLSDDTRDIHNEVALQFFGPGFNKDQRVRAKAVVYGLAYDRTAYDIAQEFRMSTFEAQKYFDNFFAMIPEVVRWKREEIHKRVFQEQVDLETKFGRHRRFWLITEQNRNDIRKQASAFTSQSTASDINLAAGMRLRRDYGLKIRIPVHDSLLVECRADDAESVQRTMKDVMEATAAEVYSDRVPFPVDTEVGTSWGDLS